MRNANDKIIQCVYGDNGINTEKQIQQRIDLMTANNATVQDKYVYTTSEINELKKSLGSTKYTPEINDKLYSKLISMRDHMRQMQKAINVNAAVFRDEYMMPVDINSYIKNITNRSVRSKSKSNNGNDNGNGNDKGNGDDNKIVDPHYVLSKIRSMYSGSYSKIMKYSNNSPMKKADEHRIKLLLKIYLYDVLAPKKCTHIYKLSKGEFDEIVEYFARTIILAKIEGGEMVGFIGAQSIGEPVTQTNLKSFHKSGTGKTVSGGLVRVKELLSVTKNIKTPVTEIVVEDKYRKDKVIVSKIASYLKYTTLQDVVDTVDIYYDPNPTDKNSIAMRDNVKEIFTGGKGKLGCQTEVTGLPWILRLVLSKEKMIERNITMLEIKTSFCQNWAARFEDSRGTGTNKDYKKVVDKISQSAIVSNFDNSPVPIVHIRFDANNYNFNTLISFQEMVITKYRIKGLANITESNNIVEEAYVDQDPDGNIVNKKHFIIVTEGINLAEIAQINGINLAETRCNDIVTLYETYGVEAARGAYIKEFTKAIESSGGFSNYQHVEILADAITHMGGLIAVNRHGANKLDTDPFSRASFEKTVEQLLAAAAFGESDHIRSVSARIMVGSLINGGTGCFDLMLDHIKVKQTLATSAKIDDTQIVRKKAVTDLIRKKKQTTSQ